MSIAALEEKLVEGGEGVYEKYIFGNLSFVIICYELGEWRIWGNVHSINAPEIMSTTALANKTVPIIAVTDYLSVRVYV